MGVKLSTQLAITRVIRLISLKLFQDPEICFPNLNFIKGGVKLSTQLAITRVWPDYKNKKLKILKNKK